MTVNCFKKVVKYGFSVILLICLVGTASAEIYVQGINDLDKRGGIALSWDDSAHIDTCYQYLPLFQKYNATCTMNVNRLKTETQAAELNALHAAGWEVALHGYNHANSVQFLKNNTPAIWLYQEIFPNKEEITRKGYSVRTLAYPYSARNANTDAILAPYFRTLRTRTPSLVNGNVNETALAYYRWNNARLLYGVEIDDWSGASLQSIENGIDKAIKTGTVLVLYGHDITPNVTVTYQTSTARLESILDYTSRNGGVFYHMGDLGDSSWVPPSNYSIVIANYTVSADNLLAGNSVTFTDFSINQETEVLDFGDGSPTSNTANVTHIYSTPGIYTAKLTVTNGSLSDSMLKTIKVIQPIDLIASFTSNNTTGPYPLSVAFTDTSSGSPISWSWDFGDGNTSTEQNPVHTYFAEGTYTVNLVARNLTDSALQTATITVQTQNTPDSGSSSNDGSSNDGSSNDGSSSDGSSNDGSSNDGSSNDGSNIDGSNIDGSNIDGSNIDGGISGGSRHTGGSGSSSGGSVGSSPEPQSNVDSKELSQAFITGGKTIKFDFPRNVTSVVYICFDSKKTTGKTTTIVEMLKEKSILVPALPAGELYKSFNVWVGNSGFGNSNNLENSVICFKVEKFWIKDKKIEESSITLNRYCDTKWSALPTSLLSEADENIYFLAKTPGFSPFAITGKTSANVSGAKPTTDNPTTDNPTTDNPTTDNPTKDNKTETSSIKAVNIGLTPQRNENSSSTSGGSIMMPGFGIISVVVCLLAASWLKRK